MYVVFARPDARMRRPRIIHVEQVGPVLVLPHRWPRLLAVVLKNATTRRWVHPVAPRWWLAGYGNVLAAKIAALLPGQPPA